MGFGLYSILSPFGIAPPPLLIAQIIGGAIIGVAGAFLPRVYKKSIKPWLFSASAALVGIIVTFIYDTLTNIGSFVTIASSTTFIPFLISGISFSLIHILANGAIFAILFPIIAKLLGKFE